MRIVLLQPILSEKSLQLSQVGQYTFRVDQRATKSEIATTFKQLFEVDPIEVRIIRVAGSVRMFRRRAGRTRSYKKAIVRVKPGQTLSGFEVQTPDETKTPKKKRQAKAGS